MIQELLILVRAATCRTSVRSSYSHGNCHT